MGGARFLRACGVRPACLVGVRAGAGGCGCVLVGRERGLVCAGRVDKWEERERESVSVGSLSLSFSSFVERMTGLEPAASTLARWRSDLLSYIRMSRRTVLLVAFVAWALGSALASIHLAYECTRGVVVSSTPRCCNIGHMLLLRSLLAGRA